MEAPVQVKSASRVLDVLELLSQVEPGIGHGDIASRLGIPKSSLTPLLRDLVSRGYVKPTADGRRFQLGPSLFSLVDRSATTLNLRRDAEKFLRRAVNEVGESAAFNELRGDQQEVVAAVLGPHRLVTHMRVGDVAPLYATSSGKILLAHLPDALRREYLDSLPTQLWLTSPSRTRAQLVEELIVAKESGHAYSFEEWTPGIVGVASIVLDPAGDPLGAVNFAIPASRFDEDKRARAEVTLKRCAADLQRHVADQRRGRNIPSE